MIRAITITVVAAAVALGGGAIASRHPYLFRCGDLTCDARTSYCETIKTDVARLPSTYACRPLPAACAAVSAPRSADCGCFPAHTRCDFCGAPLHDGVRTFYRTCVGGH